MADTPNFGKLVPGFEFLQSLAKTAGSAMPNMGQWVAPTLNPEELEKRINELRTVQFWLEQNAKMIGATIQALEVQRMTLSTLKTMNVQMGDLRDSLMIKPPAPPAPAAGASWGTRSDAPEAKGDSATSGTTQAVDPMQWWAALTRQFTELAASTMKDSADKAAGTMASMRPPAAESAPANPAAEGSAPAGAAESAEAARARKTAGRKSPR